MKLEDQVCSYDFSRKLLALGVKQNGLCFWNDEVNPKKVIFSGYEVAQYNGFCSAFTVAELGAMLPFNIFIKGYPLEYWSYATDKEFNVDKHDNPTTLLEPRKYYCVYMRLQPDMVKIEQIDTNEANARAKMVIHLLENKLITLE